MIITRTPFRISLFGGGTDYPQHYLKHGGSVIGFALAKYCWISLRRLPPFFDYKNRLVYSHTELVNNLDDIQHPAIRAVLKETNTTDLELHHDGDLPARSGLGSSSSFTVGLLHAVHAMQGRMIDKNTLAKEAIRIEQDIIKEAVGSQDQIWAAYGGLNRIEFGSDGFKVTRLIISPERETELINHLMLFFTGFQRNAPKIAQRQIINLPHKKPYLFRFREMVESASYLLTNRPYLGEDDFTIIGEMLHESWQLKKEMADGVSNGEFDYMFEKARIAGAIGGKLLGAGGGGFMLLFVPPSSHDSVRRALSGLIEVDIEIDYEGSKVVLYNPNGVS